jgi:hypothetical protein
LRSARAQGRELPQPPGLEGVVQSAALEIRQALAVAVGVDQAGADEHFGVAE